MKQVSRGDIFPLSRPLAAMMRLAARLRAIRGVVAVGCGWKETGATLTNTRAFRLYVARKRPIARLSRADRVPARIDGIDTDVVGLPQARPCSGPGTRPAGRPEPPCVGACISNLKHLSATVSGEAGLGTLGFLGATAGARDWRDLVLVSNRHVLLAHGAQPGDTIYQPAFRRPPQAPLMFDPKGLNPIARIENGGLEGHHVYAYPGEQRKAYFIDCATARLVRRQASRPARAPRLFDRVARVHPFDTFAGRELRVRKLVAHHGRPTDPIGGAVIGKVVDTAATVVDEAKVLRHNNLVVRSLPGRGGKRPRFADHGDSGALIVDENRRAVGLLWGLNLKDPSEAYACHIHPLLDFLGLTPWRYAFQPAEGVS